MSSKDYRELQLTSSQLVVIFLAIIVLGVIIFLLGISVGKKRTEIIMSSQQATMQVSEETAGELTDPIEDLTATTEKTTTQQPKIEPKQEKTSPANVSQNLDWYIQVGAFNNKAGAEETADGLREQGLNVIVLDPYASDRRTVYRVRIGGYASKELADKAHAELIRSNPRAKDYFVIMQR